MAYSNTIRSVDIGILDRVRGVIDTIRESHQRYRMYRQTLNELSSLSDRELSDLGIHRSSIQAIAVEAAYKK